MFDFECQMRFWKSATDAAFGYASATLAAVTVMQDRVQEQMAGTDTHGPGTPSATDVFNPFGLPFHWWNLAQPTPPFATPFWPVMGGLMPGFASAFFPFAPQDSTFAHAWNPFTFASTPASDIFNSANLFASPSLINPSQPQWTSQWVEMMRSFGWLLPQPSWTMWQHPMTAALMAAGMPYAIAAPTARANASAMDAADAARDGFNKAFASYRSDGGHAAAHLADEPATQLPDLVSLMMAPWLAFVETQPPVV